MPIVQQKQRTDSDKISAKMQAMYKAIVQMDNYKGVVQPLEDLMQFVPAIVRFVHAKKGRSFDWSLFVKIATQPIDATKAYFACKSRKKQPTKDVQSFERSPSVHKPKHWGTYYTQKTPRTYRGGLPSLGKR